MKSHAMALRPKRVMRRERNNFTKANRRFGLSSLRDIRTRIKEHVRDRNTISLVSCHVLVTASFIMYSVDGLSEVYRMPIIKAIGGTRDGDSELQNCEISLQRREEGGGNACLRVLTARADFTTRNRQTFPALRIARGIKMTAHWILRTGPTAAPHRRIAYRVYDTNSPVAPVIFIAVIMRLSAFPCSVDQSDENLFPRITEPRVHALLSLPRAEYSFFFFFFSLRNKLTLLNQADFPARGTYFKRLLRAGSRAPAAKY